MEQQCILVVDDSESLREIIHDILAAEPYTVLTACEGRQALQLMEKIRPDLILADIVMPGMDGYDLCKAVRARPDWAHIPFIFLSAKAERTDLLRGKALGIEDYITKPFDPEELTVAVRARLERAQAVRGAVEAEFDQLKQQLVHMLGHELRTPLSLILGYNELAMEELASASPEAAQELLWGIKKGADRLTRLTRDALSLIRLDTGQVSKEFSSLTQVHHDIGRVVARTLELYKDQATEAGVSLDGRLQADLPPVRLHEPYMHEALGRLVDNAIKFSHGQDKRVRVTAEVVNGNVEIAVTDEGVGIPPEALPKLFGRFQQFDRERMEQQGIGLGLAIARELIRPHDGDIAVESVFGAGSTFTISVPVAHGR